MTFKIRTRLIVGRATPGSRSRGAGYARNCAALLQYLLFPDDDVECKDGVEEEEEEDDNDDDARVAAREEALTTGAKAVATRAERKSWHFVSWSGKGGKKRWPKSEKGGKGGS